MEACPAGSLALYLKAAHGVKPAPANAQRRDDGSSDGDRSAPAPPVADVAASEGHSGDGGGSGGGAPNLAWRLRVAERLLAAVDGAGRRGVVHGCLRPELVLLTDVQSDDGVDVRVTGFDGLGRGSVDDHLYTAVDVLKHGPSSGPAQDVWSLGLVLWVRPAVAAAAPLCLPSSIRARWIVALCVCRDLVLSSLLPSSVRTRCIVALCRRKPFPLPLCVEMNSVGRCCRWLALWRLRSSSAPTVAVPSCVSGCSRVTCVLPGLPAVGCRSCFPMAPALHFAASRTCLYPRSWSTWIAVDGRRSLGIAPPYCSARRCPVAGSPTRSVGRPLRRCWLPCPALQTVSRARRGR